MNRNFWNANNIDYQMSNLGLHLAEYMIGICFETAKNTKAFECFFTGFKHSL